jgi:hypothetical protein
VFSFRMISDTSIECQNASSKGQATSITAVGSGRGGVESGCAGTAGLDGFLSRHAERGLGVSPLRHLSPDLLLAEREEGRPLIKENAGPSIFRTAENDASTTPGAPLGESRPASTVGTFVGGRCFERLVSAGTLRQKRPVFTRPCKPQQTGLNMQTEIMSPLL